MNLAEVKALFNVPVEEPTVLRFFNIAMKGNPYTELSTYATADVSVCQNLVGEVYAASIAVIDPTVAIEITA